MSRTRIIPDDAPTLASDAELAAHEADTTSVHGIANTALLSTTSHVHAGADITSGTVADARIDATIARDTEVTTAVSDHVAAADPHTEYVREASAEWVDLTDSGATTLHSHAADAPTDADYLVGTAHAGLSAEIVVGTTPGGELGGTWASPTVDATHAGSTHVALGTSPSTQAFGDAAAGGAATDAAKTDHKHAMMADPVTAHVAAGDPHTGYRLETADHTHATTGAEAGTVAHSVLTGVSANQHHNQAHTADHLPTGTDPVNKFSQSTIGTMDQAIANTETVVTAKVFAANELVAGQVYRFEAWFTKAGTNASSAVIRIRIGTTTLTGNIAATLTPPTNALAVPGKIEGMVFIVADGAGGTARGALQQFVHLAAVTVTSAISPATATVAVNTTTANQRVELTFISGNAANTYTFRGAFMYRVA